MAQGMHFGEIPAVDIIAVQLAVHLWEDSPAHLFTIMLQLHRIYHPPLDSIWHLQQAPR